MLAALIQYVKCNTKIHAYPNGITTNVFKNLCIKVSNCLMEIISYKTTGLVTTKSLTEDVLPEVQLDLEGHGFLLDPSKKRITLLLL